MGSGPEMIALTKVLYIIPVITITRNHSCYIELVALCL